MSRRSLREATEQRHRAAAIARLAEGSAVEQGHPRRLEDPSIARRVAVLLDQPATPAEGQRTKKGAAA